MRVVLRPSHPPARARVALSAWHSGQAGLVGLIAGAAWQVTQPVLWTPGGYAGLLLCALLLAAAARAGNRPASMAPVAMHPSPLRPVGIALLWALAVACAMAASCGARAWAFRAQALAPQLEGLDLRVTGVVADMPETAPWGLRWRFAVEQAAQVTPEGTSDGVSRTAASVRLPPLIALSWPGPRWSGPASIVAGERWSFTVRLKAPHGLRNPHGFDQELRLWEQGVQATGTVRVGRRHAPPERLGQTGRAPVAWLRQTLRDAIVAEHRPPQWLGLLDTHLSGQAWQRARGVVAALVVGDQAAIAVSDWELFRATGVAHLMSISGLHITVFAWLAAAVTGWIWRRSARCCLWLPAASAGLLGGMLLALGYAQLSGWGLPAQRTVVMLVVVGCLRLAGVRWPWQPVWLLALAMVVLADPWALWQPGFWLSFVAVGVLFASASGEATPRGLGGRARALLREQAVVTLALAPLGLLLFGQVSLVGWVANLLAIPWVTLVVMPLAFLGMVWAPLWQGAAACVLPLVAALQWLAQGASAVLFLPAAPFWAALAAVAGGIWLVLRLPWSLRLLGLPLVLPALCWQPQRPAQGSFAVLAADIGQGNAVLVRTRRHSLLYDTGPRLGPDNDAGQRVLVPLLHALGERLDMLVLSHGDNDHTGGALAVWRAYPQARRLGAVSRQWPATIQRSTMPCVAGQRWDWDGVVFEVLHPPAQSNPVGMAPAELGRSSGRSAQAAPNTRSCVLRIRAADGASALLAGDIEGPQEDALLARGVDLGADWLLVPHHGSNTSSGSDWLAAVAPRHAVIQAGYRNRYGHPTAEVLQRYRAQGVQVVLSTDCGASLWSSAQPQRIVCERQARPRYWQAVADGPGR